MRFSNLSAPAAPKPTATAPAATVIIEGWEKMAAIDVCAKALEGLLVPYKQRATNAAKAALMAAGLKHHMKPETLKIAEGKATGSAYVRRHDSRRVLDQDTLDLLAEHVKKATVERDAAGKVIGIVGITTAAELVPASVAVNVEYLPGGSKFNELLLKRIDKILEAQGIEDFILEIPAQEKVIVAETAFDRIFEEDEAAVKAVFDLVGAVTPRPVFKNIEVAWQIVQPLLKDAPEPEAQPKRRAA